MAISLQKGGNVNLSKEAPAMSKMTIGLGWDVNRYDGGAEFDLDASAFMLGANGIVAANMPLVCGAALTIKLKKIPV